MSNYEVTCVFPDFFYIKIGKKIKKLKKIKNASKKR